MRESTLDKAGKLSRVVSVSQKHKHINKLREMKRTTLLLGIGLAMAAADGVWGQATSEVTITNASAVSLAAHWKFDELGGTNAHDVTGQHDGLLSSTGAEFVVGGVSGNALKLDRSLDGMVIAPHIAELVTNDFSVMAWVKLPSGDTTADTFLVSQHEAWHANGWYIDLNRTASSKATFLVNAPLQTATSTTSINDGNWHQVVVVYEVGGQVRIYVDGSPAEASIASPPITDRQAPFIIGGLLGNVTTGVPNGYYTGLIDDVQAYRGALSDVEIDRLYSQPGKDLPELELDPCSVLPEGLVAWWPLDGNPMDQAGTNNAVVVGQPTFSTGLVDDALQMDSASGYVRVLGGASLDVGKGSGLTVEMWIKPSVVSFQQPLLEWNDGQGGVGVHFWISAELGEGGTGSLFANLMDTSGTAHWMSSGTGLLDTNSFHHVALTYDKESGICQLFHNGQPVKVQDMGKFTPQTSFDLFLGYRLSGVAAGNRFYGLMDEVSIFNRALQSAEVETHFGLGVAGKCSPPLIVSQPSGSRRIVGDSATFQVIAVGTQPVTLQWLKDGVTIQGATNSMLSLTNLQRDDAGAYTVSLMNRYGTNTSLPAALSVGPIPTYPSGLVGHWAFDESDGRTAHDRLGQYDGQLSTNGAAFVTNGLSGNALQLDRSLDGMVIVPHIAELVTNDFSVVAWTKLPPGDTTADTFLVSQHEAWYANGWYIDLNRTAASKATFLVNAPFQTATSTTSVNDGSWHQVVAVFEKGGQTRIYVDGAPAEESRASTTITDRQAPFIIGGLLGNVTTGVPNGYYTGLIDDVQAYNRALSDVEIDKLFSNPGKDLAELESGPRLLAHWTFDESTGTTAYDSAGQHDGQLSETGANFVASGVSGNAVQLDRTLNGMVIAPHMAELGTNDFSVVAWAKMPAGDTTDFTFLLCQHEAWYENGWYIDLNRTASSKATFLVNQPYQTATSTTSVNDGNWHQIVAVYQQAGQTRIYVDGAPAEAARDSVAITDRGAPFIIGGLYGMVTTGVPNGYYTGLIDDVQVYGEALEDAQIDQLFRNPGKALGEIREALSFSPSSSSFLGSVEVRMATAVASGTIRFTLDGTDPVSSSARYEGPVTLRQTTTVKAQVFVNEQPASAVVSAVYTELPEVEFQPAAGLFTNSVNVLLINKLAAGTMVYTVDGSEPTASSTPYTEAIRLQAAATIKVRLFADGQALSDVLSASYARVYAVDDGISNTWREKYFGPGYLTDPRVGALEDPDFDGASNLQEFVADTNPLDAASGFAVGIQTAPVISWYSVPDRVYRILRKMDLRDPQWTSVVVFKANTTNSSYIDVEMIGKRGFYTVEVQP